jgi:hypothetical protein
MSHTYFLLRKLLKARWRRGSKQSIVMYVFWLSPEVGIESKSVKTQAKYSSDYHHHWLDSPWGAVAFLRSCAHSSLLRATFFQFLTPNILISWSTPSSHRSFSLPTLLAPSGWCILLIISGENSATRLLFSHTNSITRVEWVGYRTLLSLTFDLWRNHDVISPSPRRPLVWQTLRMTPAVCWRPLTFDINLREFPDPPRGR